MITLVLLERVFCMTYPLFNILSTISSVISRFCNVLADIFITGTSAVPPPPPPDSSVMVNAFVATISLRYLVTPPLLYLSLV